MPPACLPFLIEDGKHPAIYWLTANPINTRFNQGVGQFACPPYN
jgi:hypothetical protein